MYEDANADSDLGKAEAMLKEAEAKYGPDDEKVSYALDRVARILRTSGTRALDAANMEARARAIRIKRNSNEVCKDVRAMEDINEAIKTANQRRRNDKNRKVLVVAGLAIACSLLAWRYLVAATPEEKVAVEGMIKTVEPYMPQTLVKNMIDKGQVAVDDAKQASEKHNKEIDKYLEGN